MQKRTKKNIKYLIITADDFGANSNINNAIRIAFNSGILNCASLMPASPIETFEEAIEIAKQNPNLDIGIHITLSSDNLFRHKALSYNNNYDQGLTKGGYFLDLNTFIMKNSLSKSNIFMIEKEIRMQIERVLQYGITPSFLNSHFFISELPFIKDLELNLAVEYGIKSVRKPYQGFLIRKKSLFQIIKMIKTYCTQSIIRSLVSVNKFRNKDLYKLIITNDHFFGIMETFRQDKNKLFNIINSIEDGVTEILFHPSTKNSSVYNEEFDLQMLLDSGVKQIILNNNIVQTNYRNLDKR